METTSVTLSDSFKVRAHGAHVWALLSNPESVVGCMPGAAITGTADDGALLGTLVAAFGPTRVTFQGTVLPEFDAVSQTGRLRARGKDARGRTKAAATASFNLVAAAESCTRVDFDSVIDMSGGLAPFMRTGGQQLLRRMLQDFAANFATLAALEQPTGVDRGANDEEDARTVIRQVKPIRGFELTVRALLDVCRSTVRRLLGRVRHHRVRARKGEQ